MPGETISQLLSVGRRYLRSAQLERDFFDPEALDGYVVTSDAVNHLRRLGRGLRPESGQRAWRITGDFGSGKSSFALLLANLLSRPAGDLPKDLRPLRGELGLSRNAAKLLPVLVTGSREPLSTALLRALHAAITRTVDGRRKLRCRQTLDRLLTAPAFSDRDAVDAIEEIASELANRGHCGGVLIILDELGKFLEFAALHPERQDVYFLQQLGEAAARSGAAPIFTLGLLHQGFSAYADKLSEAAQREWDKVGGRFEELIFNQPLTQVATLLAAALGVDVESAKIWGWKGDAKRDMAAAIELGIFGPDAPKTLLSDLATRLYPLHCTLLPVLTRFFRRFGQNERSLFSFLLSSEPYALPDFSQREAGRDVLYRLADFYDFAAHNFAHRLSGQSFRSHWNHIDAIIRSAVGETAEDQRVLKTVGLLNVIEARELSPTTELLALALGDPDDLDNRLRALSKRNLLFLRGRGGYALWPHTSVNLEQAVANVSDRITTIPSIAETVRGRLASQPVVARRHYIQTGNLRHFAVTYLTAAEFEDRAGDLLPEHPADGMLVVVLCETAADQLRAQQAAAGAATSEQVLIAVSPPLETLSGFVLELERWLQIERDTPELKDDRFAAEEVSRQIATTGQLLETRINEFVGFRSAGNAESPIRWFRRGQPVAQLDSGGSLQTFLSDLCNQLFYVAPQLTNELVNRHSISSAAAAARQKLFEAMVAHAGDPLLGLPEDKDPPEKSMYLSILQQGRIHRQEEGGWQLGFPSRAKNGDPCNLLPALDAIIAKLDEKPDARVGVAELYRILREPPYGVRDGLIPILLLVVFLVHESEIALYEDGIFKPDVEGFLMMRLARAPATFEFQLCRIDPIRRELVTRLASAIETDQASRGDLLALVRPLCLFVAGLPEYSQQTSHLSADCIAVREAIKAAKEPGDLIFHAIPAALGVRPRGKNAIDPSDLAKRFQSCLRDLRRAFPELQDRMARSVLDAFKEGSRSLAKWRAEIAKTAELVVAGVTEPDLRTFCLKLIDEHSPDSDWLEALGSFITRCPPSRWSDRHEPMFREGVAKLAGQFSRVLATCFDKDGTLPDSTIRLAVTPKTGVEQVLVLKLSPQKTRDAQQLRERIRASLHVDPEISLAALSQLMWELLQDPQ